MPKVIVLSGLSGSGKSTFGRGIAKGVEGAVIVSADDFFGEGEDYRKNFAVEKLNDAHQACFRNFMTAVMAEAPLVIVDNTCSTESEIAPYLLAGSSYGYECSVLEIICDPEVAAARNTHGVPREVVLRMAERLANRRLPPWWKVERVEV